MQAPIHEGPAGIVQTFNGDELAIRLVSFEGTRRVGEVL
jgi:hypothetical protein